MTTTSAAPIVCRDLRLRQFRNFAELDVRFTAEGAAVIGDNGAGKTNLLEALYYLEIFRSFRGAPDEQLVRFGADAFHIRGRFENPATGAELEITAAYETKTRRKRVTVDGVEPERIGDALGRVGAVVFSPSDLALVAGPPSERRRYLDIVLSLAVRGYLEAAQKYRQVLRHRNALLKRGQSGATLAPWDEALVEWGGRLIALRAGWVAEHAAGFARSFREIGGTADGALAYRPGVSLGEIDPADEAAVADRFRAELHRVAQREQDRGMTLAGPHRDDLGLRTEAPDGAIELRDFGSGGQMRTAAVALRMIEADTVRTGKGRPPMILLDDVFAELDAGRSERILRMLEAERPGQVVLTAPKESDVLSGEGGGFFPSLERWGIRAGRVRKRSRDEG